MTPKLTLLLVDDHKLICQGLANYLQSLPQVKDVFTAFNSDDAYALLAKHCFDLVVLDLNIKGSKHNGYEICNHIKTKQSKTVVAILSMYESDKCVKQAKLSGANAYFGKNIDWSVLKTFIVELKKFKPGYFIDGREVSNGKADDDWLDDGLEFVGEQKGDRLFVAGINIYHSIDLNDIIFIEASGSQSTIQTTKESSLPDKIMVSKTLCELEEMLPKKMFLRSHDSWLVNLNYVHTQTKEDKMVFILKTEKTIPIARRAFKKVLEVFSKFKTYKS